MTRERSATRRAPRAERERQGPRRPPDRSRRARRAVPAVQDVSAATRSLGLPVSGRPIGVFSLFRLPLGAFQPHDLMYVYEEEGRLSGLIRVERDSVRDEWTIVELDGIGSGQAGDIRFRLVNQVLREAAKRGPWRLHVACADQDGNVELFMQAGLRPLRRRADPPSRRRPGPARDVDRQAGCSDGRIRPAAPLDALPLSRLYAAATPQPVQRLEGHPAARLGAPGHELAGAPLQPRARSSASPTSRPSSRRARPAARTAPSSTASPRSASPRRTSPTT